MTTKWVKNWFSNYEFLDVPIVYQGIEFFTAENFFHAMKTDKSDIETRKYIASLSPHDSKKAGRKIKIRPDWESIKLDVMEYALRIKFAPGTSWYKKLMDTGNDEIVEWNNWGDRYWGKTLDGVGENHLGKLLMKIREEYQKSSI